MIFMAYINLDERSQRADLRRGGRGWLFELGRSDRAGPIFASSTRSGVTRSTHVVDIHRGWTHSRCNTGNTETLALFQAGKVFDSGRPAAYRLPATLANREG